MRRDRFHVRHAHSKERGTPKRPNDFPLRFRTGGVAWIYGSSKIANGALVDVDVTAVPGSFSPDQKRDVTGTLRRGAPEILLVPERLRPRIALVWRAGGKALCAGGVSPTISRKKKGRARFQDSGSQKDAEDDVADVGEKTRVRDTGGLRHASFHLEGRAIRSFFVAR